MDDDELTAYAATLGSLLLQQRKRMATAESCTGGWVSKVATDVAGSSEWFECALVTYSNQSKHELLGVENNTIKSYGAVSQAVVKAMVLGLLERCSAHIGVSISGIAGPGGGGDEKPVGTVWIAWGKPGEVIETMRFQFTGDREAVRRQSVHEALKGVERLLKQS